MADAPIRRLLEQARQVYRDDKQATRILDACAARVGEPLRVAVAGMVKAGQSTLLNAVIGEEIAPTDAGECTRIVTWYRYGDTPRVMAHPWSGEPYSLPIRRTAGRLSFDLGARRAENLRRIVVDWPARTLRDLTLIDTPGIGSLSTDVSLRSTAFLTPDSGPSEADAIIYLLRHLHATDLNFLEAFHDTTAGSSGTVNALAVLSRADEIGGGRVESLLSARNIAERYRRDDSLRTLALDVIPIAGLLAQTARTLRQAEYDALVELARMDRPSRERLLLSVDRFTRAAADIQVSPEVRAGLLERFGLFGIRLATGIIRGGARDPTRLAHELARRSGLEELLDRVRGQFQTRAEHLKARAALATIDGLVHDRPRNGVDQLREAVERINSGAHEIRELGLLAQARRTGLPFPAERCAEVEQVVGGSGTAPHQRLGLPPEAAPAEVRAAAIDGVRRWRMMAENPMTDRATAEICRIVIRSYEALVAGAPAGSGGAPFPAGAEPAPSTGKGADDERRTG
jgi:hypothetical protein